MNNQQAINLLKGLEKNLDDYCELNDEGKTAFRMAIEALSCSDIPNNSDIISRQQAIDALKEKVFHNLSDEFYGAMQVLDELPSVQPERPTGEWIQKPRYEDDEYPDVQPDLKCPFCGYEISWWDMGNYCARCGADLKGGAE